jgi:hypothetical protein
MSPDPRLRWRARPLWNLMLQSSSKTLIWGLCCSMLWLRSCYIIEMSSPVQLKPTQRKWAEEKWGEAEDMQTLFHLIAKKRLYFMFLLRLIIGFILSALAIIKLRMNRIDFTWGLGSWAGPVAMVPLMRSVLGAWTLCQGHDYHCGSCQHPHSPDSLVFLFSLLICHAGCLIDVSDLYTPVMHWCYLACSLTLLIWRSLIGMHGVYH